MKTEHSEAVFAPITITLETATELDWLRAVSNASIKDANDRASLAGFVIRGTKGEITKAQMELYNALDGITQ